MSRVRSSLSFKVFLGIAIILILVCMLVIGFLRLTMPSAYEKEMTLRTSENSLSLAEQLESTPVNQWEELQS